MATPHSILYYIHDPMCSWCWGFRPTLTTVLERLSTTIQVQYLLGGLAPDSNEPMPQTMRTHIRDNWKRIQQTIPGTSFNFDFWTSCQPRRSTYPACRAVIATRYQQPTLGTAMIFAIQEAYYLNSKNPSDDKVLIDLANELGLDAARFTRDLSSPETQKLLLSEIQFSRELGVSSFPSLVLKNNKIETLLKLDYNKPDIICNQIEQLRNL
jgi:putative protein-disulfide isomerase